MRDPLLDDLDAEQRAAVVDPRTPLAIIAPAGSGKTRVLTRRIAFRCREDLAQPSHVLALTFTRKAAGELVERLHALGVGAALTAGTFHAIALAQLRREAADHGREPPVILDRKARILAPIVGGRGPAATVAIQEVAAEIEWAKARGITPEQFAAAAQQAERRLPRAASDLARMFGRYEQELRSRRVLDFDDVLRRCAQAIESSPEFAASQRFRFRHLFVDEFQDATPLQLRVLRAWLGDNPDLTVVGDPAQAIYGFAGADASPLVRFDRAFPGGSTIALTRNYRSTPAIVELAETALGGAGSSARVAPQAVRLDGARPTITAYDSDEAEAAAVAEGCWQAFTGGARWRDVAVLFRTNAQSSLFEAAFSRRNVPFRVADGLRFAQRPAVKALLERLRDAERAAPQRPFAELLAELAADNDVDFFSDDVRAHRDALFELGRSFVASEGGAGGVAGFRAWLDQATRSAAGDNDAVQLVTFHRAKGLEWSVVFVTGLERGFVPMVWAATPSAQAEERRLLHVACSRAGDEMHCSWARTRTVGGRVVERAASLWLGELEQRAVAFGGRAQHPTAHVATLRETLAAARPPQPRERRRPR